VPPGQPSRRQPETKAVLGGLAGLDSLKTISTCRRLLADHSCLDAGQR